MFLRTQERLEYHEHYYNPFVNEFLEKVIYYCLEGHWAVCKFKEHQGFIQSLVCSESSLPFIFFLELYIIKATTNI